MFNPRRWLMLIAAVLALAIGAPLLFAQKPLNPKVAPLIPATPTGYLTDMAGVVKNPEEVNARLSYIRDSLKLSLVAVVLPTIGDLQPEDVALDIGRRWQVATANEYAVHYKLQAISRSLHNTKPIPLFEDHVCMVFYWHPSEGTIALPYRMSFKECADLAWGWLQSQEYGSEPDHDGSNSQGWAVFNESWGHVNGDYRAIGAVSPQWIWYGK